MGNARAKGDSEYIIFNAKLPTLIKCHWCFNTYSGQEKKKSSIELLLLAIYMCKDILGSLCLHSKYFHSATLQRLIDAFIRYEREKKKTTN